MFSAALVGPAGRARPVVGKNQREAEAARMGNRRQSTPGPPRAACPPAQPPSHSMNGAVAGPMASPAGAGHGLVVTVAVLLITKPPAVQSGIAVGVTTCVSIYLGLGGSQNAGYLSRKVSNRWDCLCSIQ